MKPEVADNFTHITSSGAIDGLYIRMKRGKLGLVRTSPLQGFANWVVSRISRLLFRRLFTGAEQPKPIEAESEQLTSAKE